MLLRRLLLASAISGVVFHAQAEQQPSAVNSGVGGSAGFQAVVLSGQTTRSNQGAITINIVNSCFGTNLRSVSNPVSPSARITLNFSLTDRGVVKNYSVTYPASLVTAAGGAVDSVPAGDVTGGATASYAGNTVRVSVPINMSSTVDESGNINDDFDVKLSGLSFIQSGASGGSYKGHNGALSGSVSSSVSKDGRQYYIYGHFPGQNGYCGGYYSPLMVFFDDKRPQFTALVDFPLNPSGKTMWPEANSPGAFIAYDRNGDGKITAADELFGNEGGKYGNGFEALREFDSNGDGVVDAKDKDFAKLLLWFDRNGDGISQKGELVPLKSRIQSVSLKYDASTTGSFGTRAELRERSTFIFLDKGKEKQGAVIDMWFSPQN